MDGSGGVRECEVGLGEWGVREWEWGGGVGDGGMWSGRVERVGGGGMGEGWRVEDAGG